MTYPLGKRVGRWFVGLAAALPFLFSSTAFSADSSDILLDLFVKKGFVTEEEAKRVKTEAEALRVAGETNELPKIPESKWRLSNAIKNIEIFGDLRLRYEQREAKTPDGGKLELDRGRYAARIGLRGEAFDDFYYGFRLDTASNPRSPYIVRRARRRRIATASQPPQP